MIPDRTKADPFVSYTSDFAAFADGTAHLPEAERIRLFHRRFEPLAAGFYTLRGREPAKVDAQIAAKLREFPSIRARYTATASAFAESFATGTARFAKFFPDFRITVPVYLVHSLGEMDGGTRVIGGRSVMLFGADVISRIHKQPEIGPFLDHELFHVHHQRFFDQCDQLWCSLWTEGLAVYVASRLNPDASDSALLLTQPLPIRAAVDAKPGAAMCLLRARLDSTASADYADFFLAKPNKTQFPARFGYYLGYLLAAKIGETMPLNDLAELPAAKVRPLLDKALADYACAPASS